MPRSSINLFCFRFTYVNKYKSRSSLFLSGQILTDTAKRLRLDPQIGGDQVLGNALGKVGELLREFQVTGFGIVAIGFGQTVLQSHKSILDQQAEKPVYFRESITGLKVVLLIEQEQTGRLKGFDIVDPFAVRKKAVEIGYPVSFQSKLDSVFFPFFIGVIGITGALFNKIYVFTVTPLFGERDFFVKGLWKYTSCKGFKHGVFNWIS